MTDTFETIPMPPRRRAARGRQLMAVVAEQSTPRGRMVRWAAPGVVTVFMLSGGVAVAAYVVSSPATVREQVTCYTEVDLSGFHMSGVGVTAEGTVADVADEAVGMCAQLWQLGVLRSGPENAQTRPEPVDPKEGKPAAQHAVPELTACVLTDGVAGVFPGGVGTCERLGLPELRKLAS